MKFLRFKKFFLFLLFLGFIAVGKQTYAATLNAGDINLHTWSQISLMDIASGLTCGIGRWDASKSDGKGCIDYQNGQLITHETAGNGGAIGFTNNLIIAMYSKPPASSTEYLADLGQSIGIAKPALAQEGTGFAGLKGILPLWKAFRNLAYLFFTIIFIAIGFAIMFRVKISPQAVVTIQAAIPRIVIALVLVTFSYAIAGLLIDLMYVFILLFIAFLGSQNVPSIGPGDVAGLQTQFTGGIFDVLKAIFQVAGWQIPATFALLGAAIGALVGTLVVPAVGTGLGALGGGIIFILILFAIVLYLVFKIFLELLKAYIGLLFSIVLAPLQIMLGAIPGQPGFGDWLRNFLSNLLVFPAVAIFLLISRVIINTPAGNLWMPPLLSFPGDLIPAVLSLGVLFMTSKVPDMVRDRLNLKPFKYGSAIGESVGWVGQTARAPGVYLGEKVTTAAQDKDIAMKTVGRLITWGSTGRFPLR